MDRNGCGVKKVLVFGRRPFTGAWIETTASTTFARSAAVAPSRGRGSKPPHRRDLCGCLPSPLHGGVDRNVWLFFGASLVSGRPFTGAWIETCFDGVFGRDVKVAPSRGRGSKQACGSRQRSHRPVAPSRGRGSKRRDTGAIVATVASPLHGGVDRNHRLVAKQQIRDVAPSRGRGSKQCLQPDSQTPSGRRPFTGAWIETPVLSAETAWARRRPFTGAWIETSDWVYVP